MEYGSGIVGHGELCTPAAAVANRRRAVHPSYLAYIEDLARKLAACGLLEQNHRAPSCLTKDHCISQSRPLLRSAPTPTTDLFGTRFQRFRPDDVVEGEAPLGILGGGYGTAVVRRDACVGHRPGSVSGGTYGGTSLNRVYSRSLAKHFPGFSQVAGDPRPTSIPRRPVSSRASVQPTTIVLGSQRRCSGTGVFLPRVNYDSNVDSGPSCRRDSETWRLRQEQRLELGERAAAVDVATVDNRKGTSCQQAHDSPPIEQLLPKDWTY